MKKYGGIMLYSIFKEENKKETLMSKEEIKKLNNMIWKLFMEYLPLKGFESRVGQENMALDICEAIGDNQHIMIEGGVGIGKSYAYLAPLIVFNSITNKPVIISTSSILLQEQLINDINSVSKMLSIYPDVYLAKGMNHFKCPKRANEYLKQKNNDDDLAIKEWIKNRNSIDRREAPTEINEKIWNKINIKRCDFINCDMHSRCKYAKLRDELRYTNGIILCNHDLLAVDLQNKNNHRKEIFSKECRLIVIDEAHNLEEKARNSLKEEYSYEEIMSIIEKTTRYIRNFNYNENVKQSLRKIYISIREQVEKQDLKGENKEEIEKYYINTEYIKKDIEKLINLLEDLNFKVQIKYEYKNKYKYMQEEIISKLESLIEFFSNILDENSNYIFWAEKFNNKKIKIMNCPKNMNEEIYKLFFKQKKFRVILTSATLTNTDIGDEYKKYEYITKSIGFPNKPEGFLSEPQKSPYNYDENVLFYYRNDMPHPKNREEYIEKSIDIIEELIYETDGRTMVLFTAKSDMESVYEKLKNRKIKYNIIMQNEGSSQESIIKEFKKDENSVLLGTGAYWEGVSIEGNSLFSLIIFKLPFPVPDPIIDYKSNISSNALMDVHVPEMIIKLKQGMGRLIRSANDKGIITILDSRISDNSEAKYKNVVLESIPTNKKTNSIEDVKKFVKEQIK